MIMGTICAIVFCATLIYSVCVVNRNPSDREGIDWRVILPLVVGSVCGGLCISGFSMAFLITYPLSMAIWLFLLFVFGIE
jgi:hypothetical protein